MGKKFSHKNFLQLFFTLHSDFRFQRGAKARRHKVENSEWARWGKFFHNFLRLGVALEGLELESFFSSFDLRYWKMRCVVVAAGRVHNLYKHTHTRERKCERHTLTDCGWLALAGGGVKKSFFPLFCFISVLLSSVKMCYGNTIGNFFYYSFFHLCLGEGGSWVRMFMESEKWEGRKMHM